MGMDQVNYIVVAAAIFGGVIIYIGIRLTTEATYRAVMVLAGAAIVLVPLLQYLFCISRTPLDGKVVTESHPVTEDGVTLGTSVSGFLGVHSNTDYVVRFEDEDDSIQTITLRADSVSIFEDARSWDEARIDEVAEGVETVEGTFFGIPVKGTRVSGTLSPEYELHVPEGAIQ